MTGSTDSHSGGDAGDEPRNAALDRIEAVVRAGKHARALAELDAIDPPVRNAARAHLLRAEALVGIESLPEANAALDQALAAGVAELSVLKLRRMVNRLSGDTQGMIVTLERMVELAPRSVGARVGLAFALCQAEKLELAVEHARIAMEGRPHPARTA
jgi:Flp pilus assembly protein TadD